MIPDKDILDALQRVAHDAMPEAAQYNTLFREKIERPAMLAELLETKMEDANKGTVHMARTLALCGRPTLGELHDADIARLLEVQRAVLKLAARGYLRVGDRALHIVSVNMSRDWDAVYAEIKLDYYDDRGLPEEEYAAMGEVQVSMKEE